ncbi:MAG: UPF0149 family protein [Gammaproteobacteria bacterium]|nr:UPF0149 family protein [Gammaproteobacteria bacterium]NNF60075.1 UPF0149 family protein [Gammaproteobacteria bacterium]NNM21154.1 UPF0149 family protein [Gammaproteobacteria bacterium]
MSTITFDELSQALASAGCQSDAAECHATLAGLICVGPVQGNEWMAQITGGGDSLDNCREVLERLRDELVADLSGGAMAFDLLLPDDNDQLSARADSLAHWCQGFLYGLTVGGIKAGEALPGDVGEVISDLSRLTEAQHHGEAAEEDEQSYTELCEYVRVGAQLVYEELAVKPK